MLVLMVMDSRQKNIFEPRFSIAPLDLDDCKVIEVKYSSNLIREMKVKVKEQPRTRRTISSGVGNVTVNRGKT